MTVNDPAKGGLAERAVRSVSICGGVVRPGPRSAPGRIASRGLIRWLGLISCLGLASCSRGASSGTQPPPDGPQVPPADGSRPPPADGTTSSVDGVVVSGRIICHQLSGDVDLAVAPGVLQAFFLSDDGTSYHVVSPRSGSNNQVTLDIPSGIRYLLQVGSSYFETDQRTVDIRTEVAHRCMPAPNTGQVTTPVTLTVSKSGAYTQSDDVRDSLVIRSFSADYGFFNNPFTVSPDGARIMSALDWPMFTPLVDATAGDDFEVFHLRTEAIRDPARPRTAEFQHLLDTFSPTVTLHSGQATTISGAFQPTTSNRTISFTSDRSKFDADYGGLVAPGRMTVAVLADPRMYGEGGVALASFELFSFGFGNSNASGQPWTLSNVHYADPFPATWKRTLLVDYLMARGFRHPAASTRTGWQAVNEQRVPFTGTVDAGPTIHPPTHPTIGGSDLLAGGKVALDGTRPVAMSWTAAAGADYYDLEIIRLTPEGSISDVASLRTTATSLAIPAQLFTAGAFYIFTLAATAAPTDYRGGHIARFEQQKRTASVISGRFRFTATCGDGVVQPGEDCDTAGESATCNVDCTRPICGDGLRNAAAGEACDTGEDTLGCDATCTLPRCGDHHRNFATEDCDDGDATDTGNGCSSTCTFDYVCGNNRVESIAEACDSGGVDTASCTASCLSPVCGDGHVNAAEECDDGSLNNDAGHCTTACKLHR
jgi:cysteine-rich repeat protein